MSTLSPPCTCGQEGRAEAFESIAELERAYRENREPVDEKTPIALVLASMHGPGPSLWLDLFTEIRVLAEGAQLALESHSEGYEARIDEFLFASVELIEAKAAAMRALRMRKAFGRNEGGES